MTLSVHATQDPIVAEEITPALGAEESGALAIMDARGLEKSQNGLGVSDADVAYTVDGTGAQGVAHDLTVRRLTPLECTRLMGLPDDWLDGCGLSDSDKYRLLGNAVVPHVAEWIARRIVEAAP